MTEITLTYFGVEGKGPTVKAAKEDAGRKLQAYVERGPQLRIVGHPAIKCVFLLWHELDGWTYRGLPEPGTAKVAHFTGCCALGHVDEKTAVSNCVRHLAGLTEDASVARALIEGHCNGTAQGEWKAWRERAAFQLAYKAATGTDPERHQWACHHSAEFLSQVPA